MAVQEEPEVHVCVHRYKQIIFIIPQEPPGTSVRLVREKQQSLAGLYDLSSCYWFASLRFYFQSSGG